MSDADWRSQFTVWNDRRFAMLQERRSISSSTKVFNFDNSSHDPALIIDIGQNQHALRSGFRNYYDTDQQKRVDAEIIAETHVSNTTSHVLLTTIGSSHSPQSKPMEVSYNLTKEQALDLATALLVAISKLPR